MARKDRDTPGKEPEKILYAGFPPPKDEEIPDVLKRTPRPDPAPDAEESDAEE